MWANFGYRLVGSNSKNPENNCVESRNLLLTEEPKIMLTSQCTVQPTGRGVRNEENEDVSGANIRIPFILKRCEFFNHLYQFTNFNIVSYWKFEAKQAKKRAKRVSELRLLKQFQFFNTFQQAISFVVRLSKFLDFS